MPNNDNINGGRQRRFSLRAGSHASSRMSFNHIEKLPEEKPAGRISMRSRTLTQGTLSSSTPSSPMRSSLFSLEELPVVPGTLHHRVAYIISQVWFDWTMAVAILINVGLVAHETNLRAVDTEVPVILDRTLLLMPFLFLFELLLRMYAFRTNFFKRNLNLLDIVIVVTDVVLVIIGAMGDSPSLSAFRLFRMLKIVRAVKAMANFRELLLMLSGIAAAMRAILWSTVLLIFTLMMFSIVAVDVLHPVVHEIGMQGGFGDCLDCQNAFVSVELSMLTFMQQIIAGDSWGQITVPTVKRHPWTSLLFFPIFVLVNLGLLNLVTAVIVETSLGAREEQQYQDMLVRYEAIQRKLVSMFRELDQDGSGDISLEEVLKGLKDGSQFSAFLKDMQVSSQDIEVMFQMLDGDGSGQVDLDEFVIGLHKMKTESDRTLLTLIRHYTLESNKKSREQFDLMARMYDDIKQLTIAFADFTGNEYLGKPERRVAQLLRKGIRQGKDVIEAPRMRPTSATKTMDNCSMSRDDSLNTPHLIGNAGSALLSVPELTVGADPPDVLVQSPEPIVSFPGVVDPLTFGMTSMKDSVHVDVQDAMATIEKTVATVLQTMSDKIERQLEELVGRTCLRGIPRIPKPPSLPHQECKKSFGASSKLVDWTMPY